VQALRWVSKVYRFPPDFDITSFEQAYSATDEITHRIDVSKQLKAKRASMRAHASQSSGDGGDRTLAAFLRLPGPLYTLAFRREWFRDPMHPAGAPIATDILEGLP